jgi:hypothetical protein
MRINWAKELAAVRQHCEEFHKEWCEEQGIGERNFGGRYKWFLQSDYWKILAIWKKRLVPRCEKCATLTDLQCHHKRYPKNWFDTTLDDLVVLCIDCHEKEHFGSTRD